MNNTITRKNVGYFGCLYAGYLKAYYPEAYEQFIAREDHIDLLKKYHVYCQEHMTLFLEMLRIDTGFRPRKDFAPGFQQELYDMFMKKIERTVFEGLTDLLAEASWMSE